MSELEINSIDNNDKVGILDPLGENLNPLNNQPYSDTYKQLAQKWSNLPAYKKADEILDAIKNNQVVLIISSTGSGKSVLIPKFVLHTLNYQSKIAMTMPKQITAKAAAEYAAKTLDVELGQEVGYQYRGSESNMRSEKTKILYATDGTIVAQLQRDPLLKGYDAIVADEIHERKTNIDFMLYLLRNTIKQRPDFKLVLMSATIDEKIFESYFSMFSFKTIDVGGERTYPIESKFLKEPISQGEYLRKGYEIVKEIVYNDDLSEPGAHDIIYFITSVSEAMSICQQVDRDNLDIYCIEVYSGMDADQEQLALDKELYKTRSGKGRKLIMATGVAESSMTFSGIKFVIDSGYELFGYYDPDNDAKVLERRLITHSQAVQRMGRAGRMEPGVAYHLYTEEDFNNRMEKYPEPNIRTSNIYQECLKLISYPQIITIEKLLNILSEFIEPPRERYIVSAIEQLQNLKLINDNEITDLGKIVADLQIDPRMGVAIYNGKRLNCSNEVIAILSTIEASKNNLSELFMYPSDIIDNTDENKKRLDNLNKKFEESANKLNSKYGDHMVIYKIINKYAELKKEGNENKINEYTYKYFLKKKTIEKAYKNYKKYKKNMRSIRYNKINGIEKYDLIYMTLGSIAQAYNDHVAYLNNKSYNTLKVDKVRVNRNSYMNDYKAKEIFYHELFNGNGRMELNIVSKITDKIREVIKIIESS